MMTSRAQAVRTVIAIRRTCFALDQLGQRWRWSTRVAGESQRRSGGTDRQAAPSSGISSACWHEVQVSTPAEAIWPSSTARRPAISGCSFFRPSRDRADRVGAVVDLRPDDLSSPVFLSLIVLSISRPRSRPARRASGLKPWRGSRATRSSRSAPKTTAPTLEPP
ncbi:hypothetical protein Ae717Ps2_7218c [Pseudonocardia sp. Ae717_Ps2]|nr:hypothetical protein Ae717Ps2_7218c [Pseudonocardia sp. Ae717_Ps2]